MKQYLLAVHSVEGDPEPGPETVTAMYRDVDAFNTELQQAGAWVFAGGLQPPDVATVVRVEGGEVSTSDGPFAQARQRLGGFWVIAADDHDAALAWAAKGAAACQGPVEVRPFQEEPED